MISTSELAHGLSELVAEWQSLKTTCEDYSTQLSDAHEEIQNLENEIKELQTKLADNQKILRLAERLGLSDMTTAEIEQLVSASEKIREYTL